MLPGQAHKSGVSEGCLGISLWWATYLPHFLTMGLSQEHLLQLLGQGAAPKWLHGFGPLLLE